MDQEYTRRQTIDGVKQVINTLTSVTYGAGAVNGLNLDLYGKGEPAFSKLKKDLENLDFSMFFEDEELDAQINEKKLQYDILEKNYASLSSLVDGDTDSGSVANKLIMRIESEISELIKKRNDLKVDLEKSEE